MIEIFKEKTWLFVLSFEDEVQGTNYEWYYLPTVEIKNYDVMIDGQNFFDQSVRSNLIYVIVFEKLQQVKEMIT